MKLSVAFMAAVLLATAAYAETECPGYAKKSDNDTIDMWTYSAIGYYTSWPETLTPEDITKNLTELWDKAKGDLKTISITPDDSETGIANSIGFILTTPSMAGVGVTNYTDGKAGLPKDPYLSFAYANPSEEVAKKVESYDGPGEWTWAQALDCSTNGSVSLSYSDSDLASKFDINDINATVDALNANIGSTLGVTLARAPYYTVEIPGYTPMPGYEMPPTETPAPTSTAMRQQKWTIKAGGDDVGALMNYVIFNNTADAEEGKGPQSSSWSIVLNPKEYPALDDADTMKAVTEDVGVFMTALTNSLPQFEMPTFDMPAMPDMSNFTMPDLGDIELPGKRK